MSDQVIEFSRPLENALFTAADAMVVNVRCQEPTAEQAKSSAARCCASRLQISIPYEAPGLRTALLQARSEARKLEPGEAKIAKQEEVTRLQAAIDTGEEKRHRLGTNVRTFLLSLQKHLGTLGYGMGPGRAGSAYSDVRRVATKVGVEAAQMQTDFDMALAAAHAEINQTPPKDAVGPLSAAVLTSAQTQGAQHVSGG